MLWGGLLCCVALPYHVALSPQRVRKMRKRLLNKCRVQMKVDDNGSYTALLEGLHDLIDSLRPAKIQGAKRRERAVLLKSILKGVSDFCESHAISQRPGLARALYTEISGHAGLPIFRRFDAALSAASSAAPSPAKPAASPSVSTPQARRGNGPGRRSAYNKPKDAEQRDLSEVMCFGCRKFGHYRNRCPDLGHDKK